MNAFNVIASVVIVLTATLLHFVPLWRREQLWFGVTVPVGFDKTPEARRVLHGYRIIIWAVAAVAVVLAVGAGSPRSAGIGAPFVMLAAVIAFARGRGLTAPFAVKRSGSRSAPLDDTHEGLPGGWISVVGPFAMIGATACYLWSQWARIPARFPVHWNFAGVADRWADRTPQGVGGPLVMSAVLVVVLVALGVAIVRTSPRARGGDTEAWTRRFRRATLRLMIAAAWGVTAMMCVVTLLPLWQVDDHLPSLFWILPVAVVATIVPFAVQIVRISRQPNSGSDGTPDECWKLGQIYFNPADPALMVEKRFGVGYTINMGNPTAWMILAVILAVALVATRL